MKKITFIISILILLSAFTSISDKGVFVSGNGDVKFVSNAPLETIKAESKRLNGIIDIVKRTFAFSIPVNSFEGFNSPLQKEHFNENYLETEKIPFAVFKGKIIEDIELGTPGTYSVRSKGLMNIHGIEKEMIIKSKVTTTHEKLSIESDFMVALKDFGIKIPRIVNQKIAEEISVNVKMELVQKR